MPASKDNQGNPIRYVPRPPPPAFPASPHGQAMPPVVGPPFEPQLAGPHAPWATLPPPALTETGAIELVNAVRQLLIDQGFAREE